MTHRSFAKATLVPRALALVLLLASSPALAQSVKTSPPGSPASDAPMPDVLTDAKARVGYALGLRIGGQIRQMAVEVDSEALARGVRDALSGATPLLTSAQIRDVMTRAQAESEGKRAAMASQEAVGNRAQGAEFLKANAAKPGVVTLPSGLQYQVLMAGKGPRPKAGDTVECNYRGTLIDGTEFDSSASHGGAADFPVTGVIKGWTEALQLMPTGSKWRLFVPADLAYGDKGAPPQILPGATLIFEVELLKIK